MGILKNVKCHAIIHAASAAAGVVGAGLAQAPCSDNLLITPIQVVMAVGLGKVYGFHLTESTAKAMIATAGTYVVGRGVSQGLVGWVPVAGNILNCGTAAGITETMGWLLAKEFASQAA